MGDGWGWLWDLLFESDVAPPPDDSYNETEELAKETYYKDKYKDKE